VILPKKQVQKTFLENTLYCPGNRLQNWWSPFFGDHIVWSEFSQNCRF